MIDLHTHSTASDGFLNPKELLDLALKTKLEALALTDHDAVSGLEELHKFAKNKKIEIINGAELSVYYPNTDMEILAINIPNKSLNAFKEYQNNELNRRKKITNRRIHLLQLAGFDITYEDVAFDTNKIERTQIRRPHFVDVLLKKGYIKTTEEAYKKIFAKGGPARVENKPKSVKEVISFIKDNGAKAILAHPIHTKKEDKKLYQMIKRLKSYGLDGIEVFHSSHPQAERIKYLNIIRDLNLITTGGSDYHGGTAHPDNKLGTGKNNNLNIPYFVAKELYHKKSPSKSYYDEIEKYL